MFQTRIDIPGKLVGYDAARAYFADCFNRSDPARETLFVAYLDEEAHCVHLSRHPGDASGVDGPSARS